MFSISKMTEKLNDKKSKNSVMGQMQPPAVEKTQVKGAKFDLTKIAYIVALMYNIKKYIIKTSGVTGVIEKNEVFEN